MPIMESPSYHGYDVTGYRKVDFEYGTNQDFLDLVAAAHERGIAVVVDLVLNHTSKSHPWFGSSFLQRPDFADWYLWRDEPGPGWHEAGGRYYFGIFWEGMPDLNLENPDVTAELYDIADFWLTDMGGDGFRLDAVEHYIENGDVIENTPATLEWAAAFDDHVDTTDPTALTVGEIWNGTAVVSSYAVSRPESRGNRSTTTQPTPPWRPRPPTPTRCGVTIAASSTSATNTTRCGGAP